jgi:hypothetical protein
MSPALPPGRARSSTPGKGPAGLQVLTRGAAVAVGLAGLLLLVAGCDQARLPQLARPDELFGISNRALLLLTGLAHLTLAVVLLAVRDMATRALLMLWLGLNHLLYYFGMTWLGAAAPFPTVVLAGWRIGLKPERLDRWWKLAITGLLLGGILALWLERRRLKRIEAAAFLEHWRKAREHSP